MTPDALTVLIVGPGDDLEAELGGEEGLSIRRASRLDAVVAGSAIARDVDVVVVELIETAPLEAIEALRARVPDAAVVVVTTADRQADGTIAMHAGAEDHLVRGSIPSGLLPRAVRYAVARRRLGQELSTTDETTGLLNLRGFTPIAEHHLRMADRTREPVVFLFVGLDDLPPDESDAGSEPDAVGVARDAAGVVLNAIRGSDVPARIAPDTFAILLSGDPQGVESLVLSRLVEAIAVHNARRDRPRRLSLSVGSAVYDPAHPDPFDRIIETAGRRLGDQRTSSTSP